MIKLTGNIEHLPNRDKHIAKANSIASLGAGKYGQYYIDEISVEEDLLKIVVRGQGERNPFYFKNPPILVDDPNGKITKTLKDGMGNLKIRRLREDPKQAITEALAHTISTFK